MRNYLILALGLILGAGAWADETPTQEDWSQFDALQNLRQAVADCPGECFGYGELDGVAGPHAELTAWQKLEKRLKQPFTLSL
jgi:hypothetical protein